MPIEINEVPDRVSPPVGRPSPVTTSPHAAGASGVAPRRAQQRPAKVPTDRWYGVYPAIVLDNQDPDGLGRLLIRLVWAPDAGGAVGIEKGQSYDVWARLATMSAGQNRGSWFMPDIDDEVLVSFQAGHASHPVVIGALWNGVDTPPITTDSQNTIKMLRTRGGSEVRFDDTSGDETVEIRTSGGQSIRLSNSDGGALDITDGHGNHVTMGSEGLSVASPSAISVSGTVVSLAAAMVTLESGMVSCSGVVRCDTIIANSVVASSYTPGAGNIW